jgi:hypothetical protein
METHAFGFRLPANAPEGQKRFPISGALCSERGIDVCLIECLRNSLFLNDIPSGVVMILDTHDLSHEHERRFSAFGHGKLDLHTIEEQEYEILGYYDYVGAICEPDQRTLQTRLPAERVLLAPHPASPQRDVPRPEVRTVRFGAGLKIKNVEVLANALPLVTTAHGARGLADSIGHALIVADDPAVFSAALGQLIADADARARLAAQAYAYAPRAFFPEACFGPLLAVIARS